VKYHIAMAIAPNRTNMRLLAATLRLRSSRIGSTGRVAQRASATTNIASSTTPAATDPAAWADAQPWAALCMTP
jgi:hypothetical protein